MLHLPAVWHRATGHELQPGAGGGDQQRQEHGKAAGHSQGGGGGGGPGLRVSGSLDYLTRVNETLRTWALG